MGTNTPPPSALQKARELAEKRPEPSKATEPFYTLEFFNSVWEHFPSIHAELERVTAERDAALKGYSGIRAGLKLISRFFDNEKQTTEAKMAEDLLTSFPEIK